MKPSFRFRSAAIRSVAAFLLALAAAFTAPLPTKAAAKPSAAPVTLRVAYIPILPMAQLYVIEGKGWAKAAGLDLELTRFSSGPAMVQALASGRFDVAYVGIGPALVAAAHGVDLKVLAATVVDQAGLIGRGAFAATFLKAPNAAAAFAEFHRASGRPVRLATLPPGSVPDAILRYYLFQVAHVKPADVAILAMGAAQMQQALLSRSVDGASVLKPIPAIVEARDPTARILVRSNQMMNDAPAAVLAVRASSLARHPAAIRALVDLHVRATRFIRRHPDAAAGYIQAAIGNGLVAKRIILASLKSALATYAADPHKIFAPTARLQAYLEKLGALKKPVDLKTLFDTRLYDAAAAQKP